MRHIQGYHRSYWMPPSGNYLLRIPLPAARAIANKTMTKPFIYFAGRFDGNGDASVRYRVHCPMKEVQGFTRSHWNYHWASIAANSSNRSCIHIVFVLSFHGQLIEKEHPSEMVLCPILWGINLSHIYAREVR